MIRIENVSKTFETADRSRVRTHLSLGEDAPIYRPAKRTGCM